MGDPVSGAAAMEIAPEVLAAAGMDAGGSALAMPTITGTTTDMLASMGGSPGFSAGDFMNPFASASKDGGFLSGLGGAVKKDPISAAILTKMLMPKYGQQGQPQPAPLAMPPPPKLLGPGSTSVAPAMARFGGGSGGGGSGDPMALMRLLQQLGMA